MSNKFEDCKAQLLIFEQEKIHSYEKKVDELDIEVQNVRRLQAFY